MIRAAALDRMPEPKLGWKASAMKRRDERTDRGDQLRAVRQENAERASLLGKLRELGLAIGQARRTSAKGSSFTGRIHGPEAGK